MPNCFGLSQIWLPFKYFIEFKNLGYGGIALSYILLSHKEKIIKGICLESKREICEFLDSKDILAYSYSLADGLAGYCILAANLSYYLSDDTWIELIHSIILEYLNRYSIDDGNISLWGGVAGFGMSLYYLSYEKDLYANAIQSINELIIDKVDKKLNDNYHNIRSKDVKPSDFDLIYGTTGILRYLLNFTHDQDTMTCIENMIEYTLKVAEFDENNIPLCVTNAKSLTEYELEMFPNGMVYNGVAHGLAGILAILAISYNKLDNEKLKKEVINKVSELHDYFIKISYSYKDITHWSGFCGVDSTNNIKDQPHSYINFSWCHGISGISHSLILASNVLKNGKAPKYVCNYLKSARYYRKVDENASSTLCHGTGSLIYELFLNSKILKTDLYESEMDRLLELLFSQKKTDGCQFVDWITNEEEAKEVKNDFGFLMGTTGVYLMLLSLIYNKPFFGDIAFLKR